MREVRSKRRLTQVEDGHHQEQKEGADLAKTGGPAPSRSRGPAKAADGAPAKERAQLSSEPAMYRAADCTR